MTDSSDSSHPSASTSSLDTAADAFAEALGLSRERPAPRAFEELFLRFSMRFPYENLTPRAPGRDPSTVLDDFVERGTGSIGLERSQAFLALAASFGYAVRTLLGEREGRVEPGSATTTGEADAEWFPHAGLLADLEGRSFLLDPALPIPILLPLEPAGTELPAPAGGISVVRVGEELRLSVNARGRRRERARYRLAASPANLLESLREVEAQSQEAMPREAKRFYDDRLLSLRERTIEVLDRWSRLVYQPAGEIGELLEPLFLISPEAIPESGSEEPPGDAAAGTLWVYDASELAPEMLRARLRSPEALLALNPAGTRFDELAAFDGGWSWRLTDEADVTLRRERIAATVQGVEIETIAGESPIARRSIAIHPQQSGSRVVLRATLSREVPPRGLAESVRKTLVFHLASELLALSRETASNES
ncbi:MAG: hypothetical protein ABIT01_18170 [Thermoanaerobaculia bacterium]